MQKHKDDHDREMERIPGPEDFYDEYGYPYQYEDYVDEADIDDQPYYETMEPTEQYLYNADGYFEGYDYEDNENEIQFTDSDSEHEQDPPLKTDETDQEWLDFSA
jgi:hypothetical protein